MAMNQTEREGLSLNKQLDEMATADGGNEEKTKHRMSEGTLRFILSMGRKPAAPVRHADDGVPVKLKERIRHHVLVRQAQVRRELCERGYVQQDHAPGGLIDFD